MVKRSKLLAGMTTPTQAMLTQMRWLMLGPMNFGCEMDPNWDERWETSADKADKYEEEDGYSLVLSSAINGLKIQ
jgi:hypothetical protein